MQNSPLTLSISMCMHVNRIREMEAIKKLVQFPISMNASIQPIALAPGPLGLALPHERTTRGKGNVLPTHPFSC